MSEAVLVVEGLTTGFDVQGRFVPAVIDVSFQLHKGETLCLVGESGSGKSLTAFSILRLVEPPGRVSRGAIVYKGRDLRQLPEREMQRVRGAEIALIFQEPMTALNPVFTIGHQIEETLLVHGRATRRTARTKAIELLETVQVPEAARRVREYPHQLSGGLRQRALIALSLACNPDVLIADEPTTALDVTIQAQILELLRDLQQRLGLSLLLITHDLGVVAGDGGPRGRDVRGTDRRGSAGRGPVRCSCPPLHAWVARLDSRRRARHAADGHCRNGSGARLASPGMLFHAALSLAFRAVPDRTSRHHRFRRRADGEVLPARAGRGVTGVRDFSLMWHGFSRKETAANRAGMARLRRILPPDRGSHAIGTD